MLGLAHNERNWLEDSERVVEKLKRNGTVDNLHSQARVGPLLLCNLLCSTLCIPAPAALVLTCLIMLSCSAGYQSPV